MTSRDLKLAHFWLYKWPHQTGTSDPTVTTPWSRYVIKNILVDSINSSGISHGTCWSWSRTRWQRSWSWYWRRRRKNSFDASDSKQSSWTCKSKFDTYWVEFEVDGQKRQTRTFSESEGRKYGCSLKLKGQSIWSERMNVDGHMPNWTVEKGLKVDGLRKWTVL